MNLNKLYKIIKDRKDNPKKGSYVTGLFAQGIDRIAQKIGEEATEVVIASKNDDKQRFIEEMADLWFHSLVLVIEKNLTPEDVFTELTKRHKKAGASKNSTR